MSEASLERLRTVHAQMKSELQRVIVVHVDELPDDVSEDDLRDLYARPLFFRFVQADMSRPALDQRMRLRRQRLGTHDRGHPPGDAVGRQDQTIFCRSL